MKIKNILLLEYICDEKNLKKIVQYNKIQISRNNVIRISLKLK